MLVELCVVLEQLVKQPVDGVVLVTCVIGEPHSTLTCCYKVPVTQKKTDSSVGMRRGKLTQKGSLESKTPCRVKVNSSHIKPGTAFHGQCGCAAGGMNSPTVRRNSCPKFRGNRDDEPARAGIGSMHVLRAEGPNLGV